MAAIQTDLTTASPTSASINPAGSQSIFMVDGTFEGGVSLQMQHPGSSNWYSIARFSAPGATPVLTPDSTVNYRVKAAILSGTASVYFGE